MSRRALVALFLTLAQLTAGCAGLSARQPSPEAAEKALRERVQARWDAVIALDFATVYGFATPSYRAVHDQRHLNNQYAAQVGRKSIDVMEVHFTDETLTAAKVVVLLHFVSDSGSPGTPPYEGVSRIEETWVREGGLWYYIEPR